MRRTDAHRPSPRDEESRRDRRRSDVPQLSRVSSAVNAPVSRRNDVVDATRSPASSVKRTITPADAGPFTNEPDSTSPSAPATTRATHHTGDQGQLSDIKALADLLAQRSLQYQSKVDAQRRLEQARARTERDTASNQEFSSLRRLLKMTQKESCQQIANANTKGDDLDRKILNAFTTLREKLAAADKASGAQQSGLTAVNDSRLQELEASLEKKMEDKLANRKRKIDDERQTEEVDIIRRLDLQEGRHTDLVRRLEDQATRMKALEESHQTAHADLIRRLEEQADRMKQMEESHKEDRLQLMRRLAEQTGAMKQMEADYRAEQTKLTKRVEQQASSIQSVRDKSAYRQTALTQSLEEQASIVQRYQTEQNNAVGELRKHTTEVQTRVQELPVVKQTILDTTSKLADLSGKVDKIASSTKDIGAKELEMQMSILQTMFKSTIGDVRAIEVTVSRQGVTIESISTDAKQAKDAIRRLQEMQDELKQQLQKQPAASAAGASPPPAPAAQQSALAPERRLIQEMIANGLEDYDEKSRGKWERIMTGFDKIMDTETANRNKLERGISASLGMLTSRVDGIDNSMPTKPGSFDSRITAVETSLHQIRGLHDRVQVLESRFASKVATDLRIEKDLSARISYLNQWRDNFSTNDLVDRMVYHIATNIPGGTHAQLNKLGDRVSAVERQLRSGSSVGDGIKDGHPAKKRKMTGSASPSVALSAPPAPTTTDNTTTNGRPLYVPTSS
ncbi:hypothetical protein GMORB2_0196 [Geosmithia morbida]|uniref:Uncharacterized protein n=1 Tax=Geosmithia morbida TaxID=1094350 RepID=A0A9P4Z2F0_9HYPO|nr:uncharacterized protein GMORB2_0196 [Geosmithia morbida]KAF4126460.1 hypothetical protein GMORB2_0196 [Geosmithia morbida]